MTTVDCITAVFSEVDEQLRAILNYPEAHLWPREVVVAWACATANVLDKTLQWLMRQCDARMLLVSDTGFHGAEGDPATLKVCQRGAWQGRRLVETVPSMLTLGCHCKKVMHRVWASCHARLACTMAAGNVLVQWHGFQPYASGFVPLSMAELSL